MFFENIPFPFYRLKPFCQNLFLLILDTTLKAVTQCKEQLALVVLDFGSTCNIRDNLVRRLSRNRIRCRYRDIPHGGERIEISFLCTVLISQIDIEFLNLVTDT